MLTRKRLRIALVAAAAIGGLIVSTGPKAQAAATPPPYNAEISPAPDSTYCMSSWGLSAQLTLDLCAQPTSVWTITPLFPTDGRGGYWATISDHNFHLCADPENDGNSSPNTNGDPVVSWTCDSTSEQEWYFWPLANGTWMIVNHFNTSMVLDARTSSGWILGTQHEPLQLWQHNGEPQQAWHIGVLGSVSFLPLAPGGPGPAGRWPRA